MKSLWINLGMVFLLGTYAAAFAFGRLSVTMRQPPTYSSLASTDSALKCYVGTPNEIETLWAQEQR